MGQIAPTLTIKNVNKQHSGNFFCLVRKFHCDVVYRSLLLSGHQSIHQQPQCGQRVLRVCECGSCGR